MLAPLSAARSGQYAALIFATLLGCTDFVDGYLARKYGRPCSAGSMDPIADKVFIAITFLPAVDLGWVPSWMVALAVRARVLRHRGAHLYERRDLPLKSSYLARYKTWVQMCGVGVLDAAVGVDRRVDMDWFLGALGARCRSSVTSCAARSFTKLAGRAPAGSPSRSPRCCSSIAASAARVLAIALMYFIVAVTYASGLGYLFGVGHAQRARPRRRRRDRAPGDVDRAAVRGRRCAVARRLARRGRSSRWSSFELAHGGLDNLLAHHRAEAGAVRWGAAPGERVRAARRRVDRAVDVDVAQLVAFAALGVGAVGLVDRVRAEAPLLPR